MWKYKPDCNGVASAGEKNGALSGIFAVKRKKKSGWETLGMIFWLVFNILKVRKFDYV